MTVGTLSVGQQRVLDWFERSGRTPFAFQRETWDAFLEGHSGLVQAPTGMGKTMAVALGPFIEAIDEGVKGTAPERAGRETVSAAGVSPSSGTPACGERSRTGEGRGGGEFGVERTSEISPHPNPPPEYRRRGQGARGSRHAPDLTILWITPLRALESDTVDSLTEAVKALGLPWTVELRTSDTSASVRKRQRTKFPTVLVTTPESMSLLLSYPDTVDRWRNLKLLVIDEWHELIGGKRGVQAELAMARIRRLAPRVRTWGLSATLRNESAALACLLGPQHQGRIIRAEDHKAITLRSLLPDKIERFPWAGHLGIRMRQAVIDCIEEANSALVFTNTRSQSELWFGALFKARPDWIGKIAIHHGSLDRKLRATVQDMLHEGKFRAVVCTSSLDLGVDFWPVDRVIHIGSPKSIARAMQRAGRSGHRPGATSQLICVPTQAFELVEFSAARRAIEQRAIEPREPIKLPLDVLAQHVVTIAAGGGFIEDELFEEVRATYAFAEMTREQWGWVMDFARRGGPSLVAYPHFARIARQADGRWVCASDQLAKMHRMNIGTITADGAVAVQYVRGKKLGSVEESFAAKLKPGDSFAFAGQVLEFVKMHDMTALVRRGKRKSGLVPRWAGGKLPMSSSLAEAVRHRLDEAADGVFVDDEMRAIEPILSLQEKWSRIPRSSQTLIEITSHRQTYQHYIFPFQGRLVHEGLAAVFCHRLVKLRGVPITATFNDYGIELLTPKPLDCTAEQWAAVLSSKDLLEDILACVNSSELARRHFREIARIAGLLVTLRPGGHRGARQLQASSELFFDVFLEFDPENLLIAQARREVLERQLEFVRMRDALQKIEREELVIVHPTKCSPLAFPLWAERIASQQLRMEDAEDRIERLAEQLEQMAEKS